MPATTAGFAALLDANVYEIYVDTRAEVPPQAPLIFNMPPLVRQNLQFQEYAGLGQMPAKPEGTQFVLDRPVVGGTKTYTANSFGLAFEVTFEMWSDDLFGLIGEMPAEMARSSRNRFEIDAATILNDAFDTNVNGFDATSLCSTTHTNASGTTYSNRPAVDIGLSQTGIQDGILNFATILNGRDLPMLMSPSMVVIHPSNINVARELFASAGKPLTANNELNSILEDELRYISYRYLTTSTNWFLMAAKGQHDLNFFWREQPIFDSFDDPRTKNAVFTNYQRHTQGFGTPRGIYGSTG